MAHKLIKPLLIGVALTGLSACDKSKPAAGGEVSMRDMEIVDGTANDSMVDLDNATQDGTLLDNTGLPRVGAVRSQPGNAAAGNDAAPDDSPGNAAD
ncbi:MAG: hypothetical protein ABW184_08765 [Sphingobium sp.]